jgi:hypothetical protein
MAGSIARRPGGRWRARYRDDTGRERARHFARKVDAVTWLDEVTSTLHAGTYVNPRAGRVTSRSSTTTGRRDSCGSPRRVPMPTWQSDRSGSVNYR